MKRLRVVHAALILIAGICIYAGTLHHSFHFDDEPNILKNPFVTDASDLFNASNFLPSIYGNRIVGFLTFALNYSLSGLDVEGFHLFNIALHLATAMLLYLLVICMFSALRQEDTASIDTLPDGSRHAFVAALLFVVHPVQIQAVTYIVQRFTLLATFFYLLTVVSYFRWRMSISSGKLSKQSVGWFISVLMSALLAFRSKEISFTLPAMLALCEYIFFRGSGIKRFAYPAAFFLVTALIFISYIGIDKPLAELTRGLEERTRSETAMPRADYLVTQLRVIVTYLRLLVLPINQNFDYDHPIYHSLQDANVALSLAAVAAVATAGFFFLRLSRLNATTSVISSHDSRLISFGIFWFFISLSIESSIIPIVDVINEHRLYLPSAGAFITAAGIAGALISAAERTVADFNKKIMTGFFFVLILMLAAAAFERNAKWETEMSIWSDVVSKSPRKARGHYNLGIAYGNEKQYNKAIGFYTNAVTYNPRHIKAYMNRGNAYDEIGQPKKAMEDYAKALILNPADPNTYFNRGVTSLRIGMKDDARKDFERACNLGQKDACDILKQDQVTDR